MNYINSLLWEEGQRSVVLKRAQSYTEVGLNPVVLNETQNFPHEKAGKISNSNYLLSKDFV